jgi:hypothetical protein
LIEAAETWGVFCDGNADLHYGTEQKVKWGEIRPKRKSERGRQLSIAVMIAAGQDYDLLVGDLVNEPVLMVDPA